MKCVQTRRVVNTRYVAERTPSNVPDIRRCPESQKILLFFQAYFYTNPTRHNFVFTKSAGCCQTLKLLLCCKSQHDHVGIYILPYSLTVCQIFRVIREISTRDFCHILRYENARFLPIENRGYVVVYQCKFGK